MSFAEDKIDYIVNEYTIKNRSTYDIANEFGTYPNKINRILVKAGVELKDKVTAQKAAIDSGRYIHPTKGKKRSQETKIKISESIHNYWTNISEDERQKKVEKGKEQWNNMSDEQREELRKASGDAVRKASKEGSKIEHFIRESLIAAGYEVLFHKKGLILRDDFEVDLFVPLLKTVIEIDGPSHFFPIWGEENLNRHIRADSHKNGLLLSEGYVVIRVKYLRKNISQKHMRDIFSAILSVLKKIEEKFPDKDSRYIELEPK